MAVPYQNLRSNTAGNVPTLPLDGLLAINQADGKLYYRSSTGVVTQFGAALFAAIGHSHGNITSAGAIGTAANQLVVTGSSGVLTVVGIGSGLAISGGSLVATGGGGGGGSSAHPYGIALMST